MTELQYPVGKFTWPAQVTAEDRQRYIAQIEESPAKLRAALKGLKPEQMEIPYREAGWTIRQMIHHIPESHMNSYIRFKLGLTEHEPTIKPYDEGAWAITGDVAATPVEVSLDLLDALHKRWVVLLKSMSDADFERSITHPELGKVALKNLLALYGWHTTHHVAQIDAVRRHFGW
jgi:uncharacterized damage-inducible protein DinB